MKRRLVSVLMCTAMVLGMTAPVMAADKDNADITIGSVIMNNSGEWFAEVMKGQEDAAKDLGVEFSIVSSDNEISKESDNVATFLAQQVDALVISPLATDASVAAVESASVDVGIPVVTWNTTVDTDVTSHIGVVPAELVEIQENMRLTTSKKTLKTDAKLQLSETATMKSELRDVMVSKMQLRN